MIAAGDEANFASTINDVNGNSPNIVSAAMTELTTNSTGSYISLGLSNTGGGTVFTQPAQIYSNSFQSSVPGVQGYSPGSSSGSTVYRVAPDIGFDGDISTAMPRIVAGQWFSAIGSSNAAPGISAILAIVDQGRELLGEPALNGPTQTLPMLYQLPSADFMQVSQLDNGQTVPASYNTSAGLGDPNANFILDLVGSISGTVTDTSNHPISGVTVTLSRSGSTIATTTTTTSGFYSFGDIGAGTYQVSITAPSGYFIDGSGTSSQTLTSLNSLATNVNFTLTQVQFVVTTSPPTNVNILSGFIVAVTAENSAGAAVNGYNGDITIAIESGPAGGVWEKRPRLRPPTAWRRLSV